MRWSRRRQYRDQATCPDDKDRAHRLRHHYFSLREAHRFRCVGTLSKVRRTGNRPRHESSAILEFVAVWAGASTCRHGRVPIVPDLAMRHDRCQGSRAAFSSMAKKATQTRRTRRAGPKIPREGAMRYLIRKSLMSAALLCALSSIGDAQTPTATMRTVPNFVTVTDEIMRAPKPEDWLMHRRNYQSWGYSPLEQINKGNVKSLQLVWARVMEPGINEMTPLVYNGVMYLGNPGDVIQAIDATN